MRDNFDHCLKAVLKHEGGYVDHQRDPGGATNLGCTKKVWEEWVGHEVSKDDIRALTVSDVAPLYRKRYWDAVRGDDLPSGVDMAVFDCAINSGTGRAAKIAQKISGVAQDGAIGPASLAAICKIVDDTGGPFFIDQFCDARIAFLQALPTFETFGKGWMRRVNEVNKEAVDLSRSGDA
jgi:lysozyme family protein